MTYGENSDEMRESMTALLGWHRIQQRLGGGGNHSVPVTTTAAERERMGQIIQRYRHATLTWCLQAVTATTPKVDVPPGRRGPATELRYGLDAAITAMRPSQRLTDLLAVRHDNQLLDAWQRLARAAAIGEHDSSAGVNFASLTSEQVNTVLKDVADLTRGLVLLDRRYSNVPGWVHLKHADNLDRAAEATAMLSQESGLDATVDARGWRSPAGRIDGPALPGLAGAGQAQHNLIVELGGFPNALNLRRILHSQVQLSHEAVKHAAIAAPDLVERFSARADLYQELVRVSRNVGGLLGGGGEAVVESQKAAARLQRVEVASSNARELLQALDWGMSRVDARITTTVERGFSEKLYFVPVNLQRLMDEQVNGLHAARQRWVSVSSHVQTPLLGLVRERLRPAPLLARASPESRESRVVFEAALDREVARVGRARHSR